MPTPSRGHSDWSMLSERPARCLGICCLSRCCLLASSFCLSWLSQLAGARGLWRRRRRSDDSGCEHELGRRPGRRGRRCRRDAASAGSVRPIPHAVEERLRGAGSPVPDDRLPEYEQLKSSTIGYLVQRTVLEKEAAALGVTVSDADVQKDLDGLIDQYFGGDQQAYTAELKKQGLTDEDVRSDVKARLIEQKLFDDVTKDITIDETDVRTYYDENKAEFETPESREVAHILVKTKKEADEIYQQLQDGADFATLAKEKSQDPGSAKDGGKLTDERGSFVPEFEEVLVAIETGEVAEPVKSDFGWHVITALEDTKPAATTPFDEAKPEIETTVLKQKKNEAMAAWVADVTKKYDIVYAPRRPASRRHRRRRRRHHRPVAWAAATTSLQRSSTCRP